MKEVPFRVWLKVERGMSAGTVGSRISNCRRVERHEGDLDAHYDSDELDGLLQRLNPEEPAHGIAIAGDVYNGTATLKNSVSLYCDFRKGGSRTVSSGDNPEKRQPRQGRNRRSRAQWPHWPQPKDEDLLALARHHVEDTLSRIYNAAEDQGQIPEASNPCRLVVKYRERKRERFLTDEEFRRLGRVLDESETCKGVTG